MQPSWGRRLVGMEGLRGLAALTVLIGHVQIHLAEGVNLGFTGKLLVVLLNGLTLFFALSGFLLYRPFATGILTGRRFPDPARFLRNRALRIFPAYLVIFCAVAFVLGAAYTHAATRTLGVAGTESTVGYLVNPLLVLPNLVMLQTFFPFSIKTGLGVSWSLSVELVFYLVLPVVSILAWRLAARLRGKGLAAALLPVALILLIGAAGKVVFALTYHPVDTADAFYLQWGSNWFAVFARSFLVQADLFAFGMLAAVVLAAAEQGLIGRSRVKPTRWAAIVLGLLSVGAAVLIPLGPWGDTAYAVGFGALILFVALPTGRDVPNAMARALEWRPFRSLGLISYSMYLWHLPVMWTLHRLGMTAPRTAIGFAVNCILVFAVTVFLSTLTYLFVEKPPLKLKQRTDSTASDSTMRATVTAHSVPR